MSFPTTSPWSPPQTLLPAAQPITHETHAEILPNAHWFQSEKTGDLFEYKIPPGSLLSTNFITADFYIEGPEASTWTLKLHEPDTKNAFSMHFGFINHCTARVRIPLTAVQQNQWMFPREGPWLKPLAGGQRVDLAKVDRITLRLERKGPRPIRLCLSPLTITPNEPPKLEDPQLPKGPLIDQLGQSTTHDWPAKTRSIDEVVSRLQEQSSSALNQKWPASFSPFGGYLAQQLEPTGFFRTHHDGRRWWLVDPQGHLFWSAGIDCVNPGIHAVYDSFPQALAWLPDRQGPYASCFHKNRDLDSFDFLTANFIRAFGPEKWREHWAKITLAQLRSAGLNTVGNWSSWQIARQAAFPYVRPLAANFPTTPKVYRDFPDVFHPNFQNDCAAYANQLTETLHDPALIGYFLMNEPTWGFSTETPAYGMIYNAPPDSPTRKALAEFLRQRHGTDANLSAAWGVQTTYISIAFNEWKAPLNATATQDLEGFSTIMAEKLFKTLTDACKKIDPHHLNLGARYYTIPPQWCLDAMHSFDVFSVNCYRDRIPREQYDTISRAINRPILVGEYHFGALDAGLPAPGICHVPTQKARGQAYRYFLEHAAETVSCVGAHWFQLYDQSALGRHDGENYNIGFIDTCNRPYEDLTFAARESHDHLYQIALAQRPPYNDPPKSLPRLSL